MREPEQKVAKGKKTVKAVFKHYYLMKWHIDIDGWSHVVLKKASRRHFLHDIVV